MKIIKTNQIRHEEGFSLVELMTVILILSVLAAFAIPLFTEARKEATRVQIKAELRNRIVAVQTVLTKTLKLRIHTITR